MTHKPCTGRNKDGSPCSARAQAGATVCRWHDPSRAAELAESRRKGGQGSSNAARARKLLSARMTSLGDVNDVLKLALWETWKGRLDPRIATAMAALAGRIADLSVGADLEQ